METGWRTVENCELKNCYGKIEMDGSSRENRDVFVSIVCVYEPTARATPAVKNKFNTELQDTIVKVPRMMCS